MLQVHGSMTMFEYSKITGKECLSFLSNPTRSNLLKVAAPPQRSLMAPKLQCLPVLLLCATYKTLEVTFEVAAIFQNVRRTYDRQ